MPVTPSNSTEPDLIDLDDPFPPPVLGELSTLETEIQHLWTKLDGISGQYRANLLHLETQIAELEQGRQKDLQDIRGRLDVTEKKRRRVVRDLGVRRRLF